MGKSSKKASKSSTLPLTPVIFINDPQLTAPNIRALAAVLPSATTIETGPADLASLKCFYRGPASRDLVVIAAQSYDDDNHDKKVDVAKSFKQETIQLGCNFVSVNLYLSLPTPADKLKEWGTNHLDLNIAMLSPQQTADKIYKWLCRSSHSSFNPNPVPELTDHLSLRNSQSRSSPSQKPYTSSTQTK
jgi:hypothetical protein